MALRGTDEQLMANPDHPTLAEAATGDLMGYVDELDTKVRARVRSQPASTLMIAAAIGFLLGAIWKS
jgi:hypothetical protein